MARSPSSSSLDGRINEIVSQAASRIADAVRRNLADEVLGVLSNGGRGASGGGGTATRAARATPAKIARAPRLCPVPGCGKPGKGPRFAWFCVDHRDLPAEERARIRAAAAGGGSNGATTGAAAPAKKRGRKAK